MRLYTASCEETLRARKLLTDWAADGILTQSQYERLEQQTTSELRTTNIFLRVVLFLFTLISVGGAVALGANCRHTLPHRRWCLLCRGRSRRFQVSFASPRDRGSPRRLFGRVSHGGDTASFLEWCTLFADVGSIGVCCDHRWRRIFALDLAPLRALVCISRRDGIRHLSARLLDLVSLGTTCDPRLALRPRTDMRDGGTFPPPLRLSR
jgi:hypothetical protein